jgi:murein DD-endopeptidase MepM/ murein hydrolase activator NlpD
VIARWAAVAALALAACPAPRKALRPPPVPLAAPGQHDEPALAGVVHVVKGGETIYRISRAYGIDAADLMETNGVTDARAVAIGTELFVPGAPAVVEIPPVGDEAPQAGLTPTATTAATASATTKPSTTTSRTSTAPATPVTLGGPRTAPPLAWPLKGVLYGRYGVREGRRHDGIDIAAPEGTTVVAAADGTVIYAGEQAGYGWIVILKHDGGLVTVYAHNSKLLVRDGGRVRRGDPVAKVGQTGRTTGPHLHFEVRDGTRPKNPLLFLP